MSREAFEFIFVPEIERGCSRRGGFWIGRLRWIGGDGIGERWAMVGFGIGGGG